MKEMKVPKNLARRISPKFRLLIGLVLQTSAVSDSADRH